MLRRSATRSIVTISTTVASTAVVLGLNASIAYAYTPRSVTYNATGVWHVFDPPDYATSVTVDIQAAAGGAGTTQCVSPKPLGGPGGRVQATLSVNPGEKLGIWAGAKGVDSDGLNAAGGGMSSLIYIGDELLAIAGAGGGAYCHAGGAGGGLMAGNGGPGSSGSPTPGGGGGGSQTSGGAGGSPGDGGSPGSAGSAWALSGGGQGGGGSGCRPGSNGGAGWFGGGGGGGGGGTGCLVAGGSGGGGSSWTSPARAANVLHTQGFRGGNGVVTVNWNVASCEDGLDNDGDGRTDYPNDSGCTGRSDDTENPNPACDDRIDNDGDGKTDYPDDPGCRDRFDTSEGGCPPLVADPSIVACLTPGRFYDRYAVDLPQTRQGTTYQVAGYVDNYRFLVSGTTVTLPCITLTVATTTTTTNGCADLGGTFVARTRTLIDIRHATPEAGLDDATSVEVCEAELTVTVDGAGLNSVAAHTLC